MSKLEFYVMIVVLMLMVGGGLMFVGAVDQFSQELTTYIINK